MTDTHIRTVHARQILDSRGRPTVEAQIELEGGVKGRASVPSGASRGKAEALELRDGYEAWAGQGVERAVAHIRGEIAVQLVGLDVIDQSGLDRRLRQVDGTPNLSRLGANAILAVSLAAARASASALGRPLYRWISELAGASPTLPMPMVNIFSGGLHAAGGMDVQDFLVIPVGASSYVEALAWVCRVRASAAVLCAERGIPTLLADEGGLSPGFRSSEDALTLMVAAFKHARLEPRRQVAIALDVAASSLADENGQYLFRRQSLRYDSTAMIELQRQWVADFPIVSIEDGLGEDDWDNWPLLTRQLGQIQLIGDDLFATQAPRVARGIRTGIANAVLIKPNQNGTLSGTLETLSVARAAGYASVISARSGETEDDFLADFAVGVAGGQIKVGSVRTSERLAKYNQLLRLHEDGLPWAGTKNIAPL